LAFGLQIGQDSAMGRALRAADGGLIYHVLNGANARMTITTSRNHSAF